MPRVAPLGDLITITRGKTYKSALLGQPGPVLLGLASIARNGGFRDDSLRTYGGDSPENLLVRPGQLFASLKDVTQSADLLGSVARVPFGGPTGRLTQDTVRLDIRSDSIDPSYLYLSLLTPQYRAYCRSHATGTTNLGLPREDFLAYEIPLPPLDEQRRIAGVLGALDDLIETNRAQVEVLEELARCVAASSSREVALADVAQAAISRQVRPAGQVEHYSLPAFDAGAAPEFVDGSTIQSSKLPITGPSVLVSRLNPRWERCWMVYPGDSAVASTEFVPLVGLGVMPEEVWAVTSTKAFWDQMRIHVTGTTGSHQRVDKQAVLTLSVPDTRSLPDRQRQLLTSLVRNAHDLRIEVAELTRTRDELLPLMMSGRIRVSDVEVAE